MHRHPRKKRYAYAVSAALLVAVQLSQFAYVWYCVFGELGASQFVRGNLVLMGLYALNCFLFLRMFGTYSGSGSGGGRTVWLYLTAAMCVNAITYLQLCLICRWRFPEHMSPLILLTVFQTATGSAWSGGVRWILNRCYVPQPALLICGSYSPESLLEKLAREWEDYRIVQTVSADTELSCLQNIMKGYETVVLTDVPAALRNDILKFCFAWDIGCFCVPKLSDVMIRGAETVHLADITLLRFHRVGLTPGQKLRKRILDVAAAVVLGAAALPVMMLIALGIKLCDGGPVFFTQQRLTEGGKEFRLYKFRSMRISSGSGAYILTRKEDERITPVGRFIRKYHLDELPQLLNILRGEMSFVGPRPECPGLAQEYGRLVPEFSCRLKVKAGLTGYAQVYGRYNSTPYDKLKLDLQYIHNFSHFLDVKLMLLTVKILFQKDHTEGIEPWQTSAAPQGSEKEGSG